MPLARAALAHKRRLRSMFWGKRRSSGRSVDEVDGTGPRLITVSLRDAQINRQVGAAGKAHLVVEGNAPGPVGFGQRVRAQLPAKAAAVD